MRQVPKSHLRILKGAVPECLVKLNLSLIERENPRFPKPLVMQRPFSGAVVPWKELLREQDHRAMAKKAKTEDESQPTSASLEG